MHNEIEHFGEDCTFSEIKHFFFSMTKQTLLRNLLKLVTSVNLLNKLVTYDLELEV
jgi:hypothetical protein